MERLRLKSLKSYVKTLDLDNVSEEELKRILFKISRLKCAREIWYRMSSSMNGYHVKIRCANPDCYICRLVFDDERRLKYDLVYRPPRWREVLWDTKTVNGIPLHAGKWKKFK